MLMALFAGAEAKVNDLNTEATKTLIEESFGQMIILDVRELDEYESGHMPGAVLIPLGELENRLGELDRQKEILVVCRSGVRSREGAEILAQAGFPKVYNYTGGMAAWDGPVAVSTHRAKVTQAKTYIEFILDASFSMYELLDDGRTRMDVAKEVLREVITGLVDRPDLEIGLRVYGSSIRGLSPCVDSALLQPFGRVDEVRSSILAIVEAVKPSGKTPIGYSLEQAALDFPKGNGQNVIVLVTDGEESCGADPCAISRKLQAEGIIVEPYVVGFALTPSAEKKVKCIGKYFSANDEVTLSKALNSIMAEVVSPPQLEVQAWGASVNLTGKTVFEIVDAAGKAVTYQAQRSEETMILSLNEGVYRVKATYQVDGYDLVAIQPGVRLQKGETTKVRLDFGALQGHVQLRARAGKQDVSDGVTIKVHRASLPTSVVWKGVPPTAVLGVGLYEFTVTLKEYPSLVKKVSSFIYPDQQTTLEIDFGEILGKIVIKAKAGDKAIPSSMLTAKLYSGGDIVKEFTAHPQGLEASVQPGFYNVLCTYLGEPVQTKTAEGVEVQALRTQELEFIFAVPGRLVVSVTDNGRPISDVKVQLWQENKLIKFLDQMAGQPGVFMVDLWEGNYDLVVTPSMGGFGEIHIGNLQIQNSKTLEKSVPLASGKLRIKLISEGKLYSLAQTKVGVYRHVSGHTTPVDYIDDLREMEKGVFEGNLKEGTYDIKITGLGQGFNDIVVTKLVLPAGQTLERTVDVDGRGTLRFKVLSDGKPYTNPGMRLMLYEHDPDVSDYQFYYNEEYVGDAEQVSKGIYEQKLREGTYDLLMLSIGEGFSDVVRRRIVIRSGEVTEENVNIGGKGKLRVNVTQGGIPIEEYECRLMLYEHDPEEYDPEYQEYICELEMLSSGIFEQTLREGTYDLLIIDEFDSTWFRKLTIEAGQTLQRMISLAALGKIRFRVSLNGMPCDDEQARLMLYRHDPDLYKHQQDYVTDAEMIRNGLFEAEVKEGTYDLQVYLYEEYCDYWMREVVVSADSIRTIDVTVEVN